jgi:DNA helicase-2/ATP-dependent DNA helicase PcrA
MARGRILSPRLQLRPAAFAEQILSSRAAVWESSLLEQLNPEQRAAVTHTEGPLLILAGAGSGKTRVLTYRVAYLLQQGVSGSRILAVTFTNKAAAEMKERILRLVGPRAQPSWIGTFHAMCARMLRQEGEQIGLDRNFVVFDDGDQLAVVKECLADLNIGDEEVKPRPILSAISRAKEQLISPQAYAAAKSGLFQETVARVYPLYQQRLAASRALDFDDLIAMSVRLLREKEEVHQAYSDRFRYILVDEYQDVNHAQYILVKLLAQTHRNLCVVGDDDQSIYRFRGADVRLILAFEKDYPDAKVIKLEQNYRSTATILDAAFHVVSRNRGRTEKRLWTEREGGSGITWHEAYNEQDEAEYAAELVQEAVGRGGAYGDCAVLYRTNAQSRVLEEALLRRRIPHKIVGSLRFYDRREVKDVIAYLRLVMNPHDAVSLRRVINSPPRSIGAVSMQRIDAYATAHELSLFEALKVVDEIPGMTARAKAAIRQFVEMIDLLALYRESLSVTALVSEILDRTGYIRELKSEQTLEAQARIENLQEMLSVTREFDATSEERTLVAFLEHLALMSDVDTYQHSESAVTLMTVHAAKGLEFPHVILVGMEEGIFPHSRALWEEEELEEERRLCYVAITRAKDSLTLTSASRRTLFGAMQANRPSRFLDEIPAELFDASPVRRRRADDWDWDEGTRDRSADESRGRQAGGKRGGVGSLDVQGLVETLKARPAGAFQPGDRVRHRVFGEGIVTRSKGAGEEEQVTAIFPGHGEKTLVASIAGLEKL